MVTNYPQQLAATAGVSPGDSRTDIRIGNGLIARAVGRIGQLICGARGHDAVLHFESNRVMMRCSSCGHDTPGWEISGRGPRRRYEGDARRHLITKRHQLTLRKSA